MENDIHPDDQPASPLYAWTCNLISLVLLWLATVGAVLVTVAFLLVAAKGIDPIIQALNHPIP